MSKNRLKNIFDILNSKKLKTIIHFAIFLLFFLFFYFKLKDGFLLSGDLASTFLNKDVFREILPYAWDGNNFLGYNTTFYAVLRIPFYLTTETIKLFFSFRGYYIIFILIYFLRYYFFYLLLRYLKTDYWISILLSLVYCLNIFFFDRFSHVLIIFSATFVPILLLNYLKYIKLGEIKNLFFIILIIWFVMSSMHIALMSFYFFMIIFLFLGYKYYKKNEIKLFLLRNLNIILWGGLIYSFIFLPIIYDKIFTDVNLINQVAEISGNSIYFYSLNSLFPSTILGFGYFASLVGIEKSFIVYQLLAYLIFGLLIYYYCKLKNKKFFYNAIFISLLFFMFLSSFNLNKLYLEYFKNYLIGFNAIKDTSYFNFYTVFCMLILIGLLSKYKNIKKIFSWFIIALLAIFTYINFLGYPQRYETNNIPNSYYDISEKLENSRVLIMPLGWISRFEWSDNKTLSGFFNTFFRNTEIVGQTIIEGPNLKTIEKNNYLRNYLKENNNNFDELFDEFAIEKIVYFKNNSHEQFSDTECQFNNMTEEQIDKFIIYDNGIDRTDKELLKEYLYEICIDYKKLLYDMIEGNYIEIIHEDSDLILFETKNQSRNKIYLKNNNTSLDYQKINRTKYYINIYDIYDTNMLYFLESNDIEWKLYLRNPNDNNNKFNLMDIKYIFSKPLFTSKHGIAFDYANQWEITTEYGNDIELVLLNRKQISIYLGIIISFIGLILFIVYWKLIYKNNDK